jgi:integrase
MPRQKKQHLKRRKDGRYCCVYHGIQFMGMSEDEALAKREEYIRQEKAGEYRRDNPTLQEYADKWLPLHKSGVSDKCYNDYKKQLDALTDILGELYLKDITVDDAAAVWNHYKDYSASTIKRARMIYVSLFDTAIENDLIRKNPFRGKFAQPPKGSQGSHRTLTDEEIALVRETPHRMQTAALIMLYAGLRRGEVLALTMKDIDLQAGVITVNKAIRFDGNTPVVSRPKTDSGTRQVPILSVLRPALENRAGRILSAANGQTMTEQSFTRCWESYTLHLSKAAGHPVNIRPHDLRHTFCTMLRDAGIDMHQAMIWMGHADEKMILRVYDHVTDKRTQNSIDQMEKSLLNMRNDMQEEKM